MLSYHAILPPLQSALITQANCVNIGGKSYVFIAQTSNVWRHTSEIEYVCIRCTFSLAAFAYSDNFVKDHYNQYPTLKHYITLFRLILSDKLGNFAIIINLAFALESGKVHTLRTHILKITKCLHFHAPSVCFRRFSCWSIVWWLFSILWQSIWWRPNRPKTNRPKTQSTSISIEFRR